MNDDYITNLNKNSLYKNDLLSAENEFGKIQEWDPVKTFDEINGGFVGILAPTGCGKSWLLREILSKIHKSYSKIYLMCPTAMYQQVYDYFPNENIINHFDEEFLTNLFLERTQKMERKKKSPKKIMVVLDDIIGDKEYLVSKILDKLSISSRPINITVIILSQYYSRIKSLHRSQLRLFIGFDIDNMDELEKFTKGFMCSTTKRAGRMLYKKITGEKKRQCCIVEIYKNSVPTEEKVKKYTASAEIEKFKIKSVKEKDQTKQRTGSEFIRLTGVVSTENKAPFFINFVEEEE